MSQPDEQKIEECRVIVNDADNNIRDSVGQQRILRTTSIEQKEKVKEIRELQQNIYKTLDEIKKKKVILDKIRDNRRLEEEKQKKIENKLEELKTQNNVNERKAFYLNQNEESHKRISNLFKIFYILAVLTIFVLIFVKKQTKNKKLFILVAVLLIVPLLLFDPVFDFLEKSFIKKDSERLNGDLNLKAFELADVYDEELHDSDD